MSASTRIVLAVAALLIVVLVLYYGVFTGDPVPQHAAAVGDVEESVDPDPIGNRTPVQERPRTIEPPQPAPPQVEPERFAATPEESDPATGASEPPRRLSTPIEDFAPVDPSASGESSGDKGEAITEPASDTTEPEKDGHSEPEPSSEPDEQQPGGTADEEPEEETEDASDPEPEPEPAPQPRGPRPAPPQYTDYTVKENDTMHSIAEQWFGEANKWDLIAKANPLVDPARLKIGQVLRLPPKDAQREEIQEKAGDKAITYTVRSGDTLSKISRAYYGHERHWQRIYDANRTAIGENPGNLKPGMKITIPPVPSE